MYTGISYWEIDHQAKLWNLKTLLSRLKHGLFSYSKVNCLNYVFKTPYHTYCRSLRNWPQPYTGFQNKYRHEWRLFCDPCKVLKITRERCVRSWKCTVTAVTYLQKYTKISVNSRPQDLGTSVHCVFSFVKENTSQIQHVEGGGGA